MSVHGGRSRWLGAALRGGWLVLTAITLAVGCGGRTSMLDPDAYDVGTDGGGGNTDGGKGGTPAAGGRPSTTAGQSFGATGNMPGTAAAPSGGTGGTNRPPENSAATACKAYCSGYGTECAQRLMAQDCLSSCINEITGSGGRCQKPGINALTCLTPFFSPGRFECDAAVNRALATCGEVVGVFEKCQRTRTPGPTASVTSCASVSSSSDYLCETSYLCDTGTYKVSCSSSPQSAVASCACTGPSGSSGTSFMSMVGDLCSVAAAALCGGT